MEKAQHDFGVLTEQQVEALGRYDDKIATVSQRIDQSALPRSSSPQRMAATSSRRWPVRSRRRTIAAKSPGPSVARQSALAALERGEAFSQRIMVEVIALLERREVH